MKTFLYDLEISDYELERKLRRNVLGYFEEISDGHYVCKGYDQPLLAHISNEVSFVCCPFKYSGAYEYKGENEISLHATYGRVYTYKKMIIFGMPFMVCTNMTNKEAITHAMADVKFVTSLIKALA